MDALKSIFSWLGKFLEKTRVVLLNVATAFILIVITVAILGGIFSSDAEIDKEGKVVFLDPAVVIMITTAGSKKTTFPSLSISASLLNIPPKIATVITIKINAVATLRSTTRVFSKNFPSQLKIDFNASIFFSLN